MANTQQRESSKNNSSHTSVTRIGQGLVSCQQVQELQQHATRIHSVCLHGNNISRMDGLDKLVALRELNLSSNAITHVEGLQTLGNLTSLNLASNKLSGALGSLAGLTSLTHLNLAYNGLTSLAGVADLQGPSSKLRVLNVKQNLLGSLQHLAVLAGCVGLRDLSVAGNPISQLPNHRQAILNVLPHITQLDSLTGDAVLAAKEFDSQAAQSIAAARLQAFEPPLTSSPQPAYPNQHSQSKQGPRDSNHSPGRPAPTNTPHIDLALQQHQSRARTHDQQAPHGGTSTYPGISTTGRTGPAMGAKQAANWQTASGGRKTHKGGYDSDGMGTGMGTVQRVYLKDAAVQASDQSNKAIKQLQAEGEQLKQQLAALASELEQRNAHEEELRQQMSAAVQAMEEEAHRRVEEGYREASQAVHKALGEVDISRRATLEVQQRADALSRREEELRRQVVSLEKDLTRSQEELQRTVASCKAEVEGAGRAAEVVRQRMQETEQQLRQQLQAGERDLGSARAALAAAEQRAVSLEAALQQSNAVAVTMTSRIAQNMAEGAAQVDGLKSRVSGLEQSLGDATRREAELKAEVSMLTGNITTMQQRHAQELDQVRQHAAEEARVRVSKEVAAAEDRVRAAAVAAAQQERGPMQEQIAFLKAQLQFALKEGEKESSVLQEQLGHAQQQLVELQQAVHQSMAKQREHEALVTDLGNVVSQQKSHIQTLQKERDNLSTQLRGAGPEQMQRLASEVASLRAAAAEAGIAREQAEHSKKQWQEAERRLAEAQGVSVRKCEELSQQVTSLEAALGSARQDAKQAHARAEGLASQLASAEDALKVKKAMLDSANDTISSLKAEVSDLAMELEDARRAQEELEMQAQRQAETDAQEKANLRAEVEAGEAALEAMSSSAGSADARVAAAEARAKEHETKVKSLEKQLADKDELIKYVEEEVERVKGLYEKREARLREERDAARAAAATAEALREGLEARLSEQTTKADLQAADLQAEREAARAASQAYHRSQEEVTQLAARLAEAESELRSLLAAVEKQKASSAVKMRQLATLLSDMG